MALDAVAAELPLATVNASEGVLVVHCSGGDEVYTMTKIPPATASLVEAEKKDILKSLGLKSVFTDLNRVSDLLFLAFMATWGTGDLVLGPASQQSRLLDLCGICEVTMDDLKKAGTRVLGELLEAFESLLKANEKQATKNFGRCADHAKTMSAKYQALADGFESLKDETVKGEVIAIEKLGEQIAKIEELEKKQAASAGVQFKGFILMPGPSEVPDAAEPQASGPGPAQLRASEATIAKAKEDLAKAEDEEAKAMEEKKAVARKVFEAEVDKTEKQARLEEAKLALDASSANLEKLLEEQQRAKERLTKIKRKKELALAASTSSSIATSPQEVTHAQGDGSKELVTTRLQLLQLKIEKEIQRRKALGDLAVLVYSLDVDAEVGQTAKEALSIAKGILANIRMSLNNMQRFCEDLATAEELQKIRDQILSDQETKEQRVRFYKSRNFVPIAVAYICKWTAATSFFDASAEVSDKAKKTVEGHMCESSPTPEEAKKLIEPLKSRLREEFIREATESDTVKAALVAEKLKIEARTA